MDLQKSVTWDLTKDGETAPWYRRMRSIGFAHHKALGGNRNELYIPVVIVSSLVPLTMSVPKSMNRIVMVPIGRGIPEMM